MSFKTSDSLSRCDPTLYTNIYTATNRPDIKVPPHPAISKDTISISREQLHNDAMRQIKHPIKFVIAQSSFMRIGKIVFLAIAFPPYMAFVELPKWVLTQAIPFLVSQLTDVGLFIKKRMDPFLTIASKHVLSVWQVIQKSTRVLTDPFKRMWLEVRQGWQRYREKWTATLTNAVSQVKRPFTVARAVIEKRIKKMGDRIVVVKEKAMKALERAREILQAPMGWMRELPNQMVILGFSPFTFFQQQGIKIHKTFAHSQSMAKKMTDKLMNQVKKGISFVQRVAQPCIEFYRQRWIPFWLRIKQFLKTQWNRARDFLQHKKKKTKSFFEEKQEKIKKLSDARIQFSWIKKFHGKRRVWLMKFFFHPTVSGICKHAVQLYCAVALMVLQLMQWSIDSIDYSLAMIAKGWWFVHGFYQKSKEVAIKGLDLGIEHGIRYSIASCYYFLLGMTITGILCRWGLRSCGSLIHTTKNSLVGLIRGRNNPTG